MGFDLILKKLFCELQINVRGVLCDTNMMADYEHLISMRCLDEIEKFAHELLWVMVEP